MLRSLRLKKHARQPWRRRPVLRNLEVEREEKGDCLINSKQNFSFTHLDCQAMLNESFPSKIARLLV